MDLHKTLTRSSMGLEHDLAEEAKQLRKVNVAAGIDVDGIDEEIKSSVESQEDL